MLRLTSITKDYLVADTKVHALKGIDLCFRKNEFVSVLGPSGCGKTTLLNIIGGLDHSTSGDLTIYGKSTKEYKDRDWDVYRNHRVGFIFQSYNLIPHQTVLGNVELALTIAGLSKEERITKAKAALDKVGLSDQYYKRPNQLSGGQSQRVAIARSLVNDPEILLADEPTGALDTVTSKQIMDIIKEIAKERLVIMVTHNSELAKEYSTRIIQLLDGNLIDDNNSFSADEESQETALIITKQSDSQNNSVEKDTKKKEKSKMSFLTATKLSTQNLFSKKKRTILTSIASSIGIIGISLVLSISYGMQSFITNMQNDMLSGNPITITEKAFDINSMMQQSGNAEKLDIIKESGYVNINAMIETLAKRAESIENMMIENNIKQEYVDYVTSIPKEYAAAVFLDYGIDITNNLYIDFYENKTADSKNLSVSALRTIYTDMLKQNEKTKDYASMIMGLSDIFMQTPNNEEYILSQYNVLDGGLATAENEVMIVLDKNSMLTDLLLAQLGYYTQEEFINMIFDVTEDDRHDSSIPAKTKFSYSELKGKTFTYYPNDTVFGKTEIAKNPFTYYAYSNQFTKSDKLGAELKIVGILEPKEDISYGSLTSGFYYTEALTNHIMSENAESEIINYLIEKKAESFPVSLNPDDAMDMAVVSFMYSYNFLGTQSEPKLGLLGKSNSFMEMMGFGGINTITLRELGGGKAVIDGDVMTAVKLPSKISVYSQNLEQKNKVLAYLDAWNKEGGLTVGGRTLEFSQREKIVYTDTLSLIFNMIGNVINMITYALIGFTALALLVSCVMIAIVTYISVVERTKEIGVIRSLGGRKRDVSNLFVAETVIIGLAAGLIAILFTYLVSFLINLATQAAGGLTIAVFPWHYAVIMLSLSVGLTLISGLFPSKSAAKKDPVVALRTE